MIKTQITDGNNYMKTGVGITSHTLHSQGGKFSMARPRDTLITRVSNKKTLGPAEIDFRKTVCVYILNKFLIYIFRHMLESEPEVSIFNEESEYMKYMNIYIYIYI